MSRLLFRIGCGRFSGPGTVVLAEAEGVAVVGGGSVGLSLCSALWARVVFVSRGGLRKLGVCHRMGCVFDDGRLIRHAGVLPVCVNEFGVLNVFTDAGYCKPKVRKVGSEPPMNPCI